MNAFVKGVILVLVGAAAPRVADAAGGVRCLGAWARPAQVGGTDAAYLSIINDADAPDVLERARSPAAETVSLHESRKVGQVMTMRALGSIPVPAHGEVRLAPRGVHLMLEGVRRPLRPGDRFPILLTFANAGPRRVEAVVSAGPPGPAAATPTPM